ncbi:hypothetical protein M758_8G099600 [Ceratodon purpureus]|uniref:Uncharacterized protein n=1 Tax=Ceratodon purpureus TaxID=3225 RepID=A0A8T0GXE6_CERPU|nr:hypothetical protein KC19_8G103900 [Ceratodon purpureus]KAG0608357.1 hypothetical protein M758_8G099600 [Ceratodon purpureus]
MDKRVADGGEMSEHSSPTPWPHLDKRKVKLASLKASPSQLSCCVHSSGFVQISSSAVAAHVLVPAARSGSHLPVLRGRDGCRRWRGDGQEQVQAWRRGTMRLRRTWRARVYAGLRFYEGSAWAWSGRELVTPSSA